MPNPTSKLNLVINGTTTQLDIHDANAVDLTNNQTVAGNKEFTGTTTAHDLVPGTTDTYNFGSSSYQWNNAYIKSLTINGVACGDILTHNVSEFVDISSNQTIGGVKTFSNGDKTFNDSAPLRIQGCNKGNEFSGNARTVLELRSNRDTADKSCIYITKFRQNRAQGSLGDNDSVLLTMDVFENKVRTNDLLRFTAHNWINDVPTEMFLEPPTKASNIQSFLGTSSRPWGNTTTNAINGINPGALSLPSSTYINVDTTNWDVAGGTNVYTPPANGWLHIRVVGATELMVRWTGWGFGDRRVSATATDLGVTIPVVAGVTVDVVTVASGFDGKCQFFPCQGNV